MWWLAPWALFLVCLGGVAVASRLWRRTHRRDGESLVTTRKVRQLR
jgi:hypothetical protein